MPNNAGNLDGKVAFVTGAAMRHRPRHGTGHHHQPSQRVLVPEQPSSGCAHPASFATGHAMVVDGGQRSSDSPRSAGVQFD